MHCAPGVLCNHWIVKSSGFFFCPLYLPLSLICNEESIDHSTASDLGYLMECNGVIDNPSVILLFSLLQRRGPAAVLEYFWFLPINAVFSISSDQILSPALKDKRGAIHPEKERLLKILSHMVEHSIFQYPEVLWGMEEKGTACEPMEGWYPEPALLNTELQKEWPCHMCLIYCNYNIELGRAAAIHLLVVGRFQQNIHHKVTSMGDNNTQLPFHS